MKKVASILAMIVFTIGLVSCEADSTSGTDALYDVNASDGDDSKSDDREN